ncbi:predicted protein [Nematostella vectensis]|uniref:Uncharacterized protein n=1 Tax=Nematostella vectensis TaxID=45351 RepID=A7T670_NEMVE|nr:predicted protein [Nematostella vectensis]|eukprot:XP_001620637.1 hypothetical protein NEMVEDRAFT_v1g222887 [Nematostella vectensis]
MVRFKKRYFLVEVEYEDGLIDDSVQKDAMRQVVKEAVKTAFGDYGLGCIQQFLKAEKEKVSSLIESATKEESVLDSVWVWRRRTKALTQKTVNKEKNTDLYGDSDSN